MFDFDYYWLVLKTLTKIEFPRPISGKFLLAFLRADLLCCSHNCATCTHRQYHFSPPTAPGGMYMNTKKKKIVTEITDTFLFAKSVMFLSRTVENHLVHVFLQNLSDTCTKEFIYILF